MGRAGAPARSRHAFDRLDRGQWFDSSEDVGTQCLGVPFAINGTPADQDGGTGDTSMHRCCPRR